nr:conserved hypothetical protein [Xanthomonas citri pv. citri]
MKMRSVQCKANRALTARRFACNVMQVSEATSRNGQNSLDCRNVMNLRRIARLRMGWNLTSGGTH